MQKENLLRALRDLAELYQSGGLTREEFQTTKELLLAQMRRVNQEAPRKSSLASPPRGVPAFPQDGSKAPARRLSSGVPPLVPIADKRAPVGPSFTPATPTSPRLPVGPPPGGDFEALDSLLQDLQKLRQQGALDDSTFQAGHHYLLKHLHGPGDPQPGDGYSGGGPTAVGGAPHGAHPPSSMPGPFGGQTPLDPQPHTSETASLPRPGGAAFAPMGINQTIAPGRTLLGRYYLERLLGQGGMGQVFLCYDKVREGHYALKVIHPHLAQYEDLRQRFLQELKVTERLTHPGIVRTYTLEQDPSSGFLFFTMEYVRGVTLEALLRQAEEQHRIPPLALPILVPALDELVQILEYAHQQGVIHRDLKPSNIMVSEGYHVKLMDFGIAKVLEGTSVSKHTGFGGFVYYMAPEQLRGGGVVSPASDVFSLGVITYQLLTGEIPMGTIEPPSALWQQLPPEVDTVVLKAMSPRAHQRYATPKAYWDALLSALGPLLTNIALPSLTARPTRPVSLDEVLQKLQQTHPQDAIDLSAKAQLPTQLAEQLLQDLSAADLPPATGHMAPDLFQGRQTPSSGSADGRDDVYPSLGDDADVFAPLELPTENLSASLEISLDGSESMPPSMAEIMTHTDSPYMTLDLPPVPEGVEEKLLRAKDGTPLLYLVKIPEGPFSMGSNPDDPLAYDNEGPQREVALGDYWIARTPITHRIWWKFLQESQYQRETKDYPRLWETGPPADILLEHPVVDVSIDDVTAFCEFYDVALPTEAQWEKAARGLEPRDWPWGDDAPSVDLCNFRDVGLGHTTPVAQYPKGASPYGLLDCSGNAWEWCADHWNLNWLQDMGEAPKDPLYTTPGAEDTDAQSPVHHAIRGGCYRYHARGVRCAFRFSASAPAPYISARIIQKD